ncbi:MAG: transglycosylase SLT domain-containing protein [Rhodanobacteraceae bacterium]|nr:transglycosylase SLT domain-containing protein [Rhodanobacteraceae bacterium]
MRAWLLATLLAVAGCATHSPRESSVAITQSGAGAMPEPSLLQPVPVPPASRLTLAPDLWQRFAAARHWQPCELTPGISKWIGRYAPKPERFGASLAPMAPLMDYVLARASAAGLPGEIMLVPIVESHYRPDARGPGGALGMWQLMPDTARRFGLAGRGASDGRIDVRGSTDAALRLLEINSDAFSGNPKLMFAAYNAGAYRLRKALAGRDYASMRSLDDLGLPRVTREYLDKIKALGCLIGEPARFGVELPPLPAEARLVEVSLPLPVALDTLAAKLSVPAADLRRWNLGTHARGASDPAVPLLLPQGTAALATELAAAGRLERAEPRRIAAANTPRAGGRTHRVSSGDSLWTISKRYRVRMADLMRWNGLNKRSVLRIGQTIQLQGNT